MYKYSLLIIQPSYIIILLICYTLVHPTISLSLIVIDDAFWLAESIATKRQKCNVVDMVYQPGRNITEILHFSEDTEIRFTQWDLDKMAEDLNIFSNTFRWMNYFLFWFGFHWSLSWWHDYTTIQLWLRCMHWLDTDWATRHYLNQRCVCVIRPDYCMIDINTRWAIIIATEEHNTKIFAFMHSWFIYICLYIICITYIAKHLCCMRLI